MKPGFFFTLAFLLLPLYLNAQNHIISGMVIDSATREPLAFVNILYDNSGRGAVTSIDGKYKFTVREFPEKIILSYVGYNQKSVPLSAGVDLDKMIIELSSKAYDLNEVYIYPGENPAHRIIGLATENRKSNNPEKMGSFSYLSYDKMIFTVDMDSLAEPKTRAAKRKRQQEVSGFQQEDHSDSSARKMVEEQHLLLMESISSRRFIYPDKEKEEIIASRVSGLEKPSFVIMARQFQSFSFYNDFISISEKKYLNPLCPGSTDKYFFMLEDTLSGERNDTVFIISFRPKKGKNFDGLKGLLYINSYKWAVQNVIAEAAEQQNELISIKIRQKYDLVDDHWFPVQLNTHMIFNKIAAKTNTRKMKIIGIGKSYLLNIRINPELEKRDFGNVYFDVNRNAHLIPEDYWKRYRAEPLSQKDLETYRVVDSIGKMNNFDKRFSTIETLMTGYLPGRYFNTDLRSIIDYSSYEGWKLGLGGNTNRNVSGFFSLGGHFAYGFGDDAWKYGFSANFNLDRKHHLSLRFSYLNDLEEAGGYKFLEHTGMFASESFRKYMVENMDLVKRKQIDIGWKMMKYLSADLFFRTSATRPSDLYMFSITTESPRLMINDFNFTEIGIMTRYAFREGLMKTPEGNTFSMGTSYPVLYLNITRGLNLLEGNFNFTRIESGISKSFTTRRFGNSKFNLHVGFVNDKVPYSRLYTGTASYKNFGVETENSFATMRFNEFLSDRFVSFYFKQDFGKLLFRTSNFKPVVILAHNMGFGWLNNKEYHNNIDFKSLEKGYFESGVLINNLIVQKMFGYGIGLFYRYGPYSFERINKNFALKLTFSLTI